MIVKDLLFQCSIDDVVDAMLEKESEDVSRDVVHFALDGLISELKNRTPILSDCVVLGGIFMNFGEPLMDAKLYNINEIRNEFKINSDIDKISDINSLSDFEIETLIKIIKLPETYGYEYEAWNNILGYNVDEDNAKTHGKAKLLADILYDMTFFGFDESSVDKERKILEERAEELENIVKLPKEEKKKHFVSWEDMKKELGIEEGSPEEKERRRKEINKEFLYNRLQSYKILREYMKP